MLKFIPIVAAILFLSCSNQSNSPAENTAESILQGQKGLYSDSGQSSIELLEHGYKKTEVTYHFVYPTLKEKRTTYVAKKTETLFFVSGSMKGDKKIKVEMTPYDEPGKSKIIIDKVCDIINLKDDYYEVVVSGCCGAENEIEYYDYNNQLIIQGTSEVIKCEIPNSKLKFYAASGHGVQFSYSSTDRYTIDLKYPPDLKDYCGPVPPEVYFRSSDKNDKYLDGVYEFWSLNDIESKEQINNITLVINYSCIEGLDTLAIPIINGKPFGKDDRHQTVSMKLKDKL